MRKLIFRIKFKFSLLRLRLRGYVESKDGGKKFELTEKGRAYVEREFGDLLGQYPRD